MLTKHLPAPRTLIVGLAVCGALALPNLALGDPAPSVPPDHPVYEFLERSETRGYLATRLPSIRPFSRGVVARHLEILRRQDLSQSDKTELKRHLAEFTTEIGGSPTPSKDWSSVFRGDVFSYRNSEVSLVLNPAGRQSVSQRNGSLDPEETVSTTRIGFVARGKGGRRFGFRAQHFEAREWSTRSRNDRVDILSEPIEEVQFKGNTVDFRETRFQFLWSNGWLTFDLGKDSFGWGPSPHANLFLRSSTPSYYYGRVDIVHRAVRFSHFFGAIASRPGAIDTARTTISNGHSRRFKPEKRMSAHRLEVQIGRFLLGLQESVVYGDRGFELAYITPASVFVGAQSYLDDTDNLAVGLDVSTLLTFRTKIYASLFFDDLKKFAPTDFATKTARQAGLHLADPLGIPNLDAWVEYTHIDPFVYSHLFHVNAYEHFDAPLGHSLGPNADQILWSAAWRPTGLLRVSTTFARLRSGENFLSDGGQLVNVGGDLQLGQRPEDPFTKTFLAGTRINRTEWDLALRLDPTKNITLRLNWRLTRESTEGARLTGRRLDADLRFHTF